MIKKDDIMDFFVLIDEMGTALIITLLIIGVMILFPIWIIPLLIYKIIKRR